MQAYIQAKLGVTEAWVGIPQGESLHWSWIDDGTTASEEVLEARRMRRLKGTLFSDSEERRSRKIEDEEDTEVPDGGERKKYKHRTMHRGYRTASESDNNAEPSETPAEGVGNAPRRSPPEQLPDEHFSRVPSATASVMSSEGYNAAMDLIAPTEMELSIAATADPKEDDDMTTTLRLRLLTARDRMHKAMIELSATCRTYNHFGPGDGLDIIKKEINFNLFREDHSTWWTEDPPDDEEI